MALNHKASLKRSDRLWPARV